MSARARRRGDYYPDTCSRAARALLDNRSSRRQAELLRAAGLVHTQWHAEAVELLDRVARARAADIIAAAP